MDRCPACRARLNADPQCPRCGCDLSVALRAEHEARRLTMAAVQALAAGEHENALCSARQALTLKQDTLTEVIVRLSLARLTERMFMGSMLGSHRPMTQAAASVRPKTAVQT